MKSCYVCGLELTMRQMQSAMWTACIVCNAPYCDDEPALHVDWWSTARRYWAETRRPVAPGMTGMLVPPHETMDDVVAWKEFVRDKV